MSEKIQLLTQSSEGLLATDVSTNAPVIIQAQPGINYELRDMESKIAPQQTLITRNGDNLELRFGDATTDAPVFILAGYYTLETESPLIGIAESGLFYRYVPQKGVEDSLSWNLDEGESSFQSLGYDGESSDIPWWPILLGALLLGGGAAALAGGSSGGGDSTAPDAPTIDDTNGKDKLMGKAEPNSTVDIDVDGDGESDYTTTTDPGGNWEVDLGETEIPDGTEIEATATDPDGNTSPKGSTIVDGNINVTIDAESLADTNDNTPLLTGTVDNDAVSVIVNIGGTDYTAVVDNENGIWSLEIPEPGLVDGEDYDVTVTATDDLGNVGYADGDLSLTIDTVAPDAPVIDRTNGKETLDGTAEAGSIINLDIDGDGVTDYTTTTDAAGNWSVDLGETEIPDETEISATATDSAGNTSGPGTETVDAVMNVSIDPASLMDTNDNTPFITGTMDTDAVNVVVTINGKEYAVVSGSEEPVVVLNTIAGTWSLEIPDTDALPDGDYTVTAIATDELDNVGSAGDNLTLSIDSTPPEVVQPTDQTDPNANPLNGEVSEAALAESFTSVSKTITFSEDIESLSLAVPIENYATTNGDMVTWELTIAEDGIQTLTGTTNDGANTVATMVLTSASTTTADYTFNLYEALQHSTSTTNETAVTIDNLEIAFALTFADTVGNENTENIIVNVIDDIPTVAETPTTTVTNDRYDSSVQIDAGEDGLKTTVITIAGNTYTYTEGVSGISFNNDAPNNDGNNGNYTYDNSIKELSVYVEPLVFSFNVESGDYVVNGEGIEGDKVEDVQFVNLNATKPGDNIIIADDSENGTIRSYSGNDIIVTNANTFSVHAGEGDDLIIIDQNGVLPASDRLMWGEGGSDTYRLLSDSIVTIRDFNIDEPFNGGDLLDLSQYLGSDLNGGLSAANLTNYISISVNNNGTISFYIDKEGGLLIPDLEAAAVADSTITFDTASFSGLSTDIASETSEEIIQKLLSKGNLIFTSEIKEDAQAPNINVMVTDGDGDSAEVNFELTTVAPVVTFNNITTDEPSPELSGYVNQSTASIMVTIDGVDYVAVNNQDGSWTLPADTLGNNGSPLGLTAGEVEVEVTASNLEGLEGTDDGMVTVVSTVTNTLIFDDGINLDFTGGALASFTNIDVLDLGEGNTGYTLTLTGADVETLTDEDDTLYITGDEQDSVVTDMKSTGESFTDTSGVTYNEYSIASGGLLFVNEDVAVTP